MACSLEAGSIGKLEDLLECSICLGTVKDPRTLPCFHCYCKSCLERFVKNHREKAVGRQVQDFECPNCRSQFTLNPGEEVTDMKPNHFICNILEVMAVQNRLKVASCSHCEEPSVGRCVDCEVFLCKECLAGHNNYRGFAKHSVLSMDELSKPENEAKIRKKLYCQVHPKKMLKFYCEKCEEVICRDCTDFNHEKPEHSWLPVDVVAEKQKQLLAESCPALENKLKRGNQALKRVTDVTQSLEKVKERVKLDINARRDTILKAVTRQLNEKAQDLINQVDGIYSRKHDSLAKQKVEFQAYVEKLERCVNLSKGMLTKGTDEEILSSAKMMKENIEKVQKEIPKTVEPNGDDKICYEYGPMNIMTVGKVCAEMGKVEDRDHPILRKIDKTPRISYDNDDSLNGDLAKEVVYVIVNPANQHLKHDGGAAETIVKSGGKEIQDESFAIINQAHMTWGEPKVEDKKDKEEKCSICLEDIKNPKVLDKCKHKFCTPCIDESFKHRQVCPICSTVYGKIIGNQPDGTMTHTTRYCRISGYDRVRIIEIEYNFRSGTQGSKHPNPGQRYYGTSRTAFLPDSKEGRKVLGLLRRAFDQRLTFTIGTSTTTGSSNQVTWNDIHHKSNISGGPTSFGYPDPEYIRRVQDQLKAKGIE